MGAWHSPQSIFNLGHRAVKELFTVPVQIQEKVDGSFFAFGLFPSATLVGKEWVEDGEIELKVRSKGAVMNPEAPEALFKLAVKTVKDKQELLHKGWQYRGEVLAKPHHNALTYERVPTGNVILFDALTDEETYLTYEELKAEGDRLGLEVVPQLYAGMVEDAASLRKHLETVSILGGQTIEGIVIKPLTPLYAPDKKMLFGKFVSEAFKEVHRKTWGESNPGPQDIITTIGNMVSNQARYAKALIHLREEGKITDSLKDIGLLINAIPDDIKKELEDEMKEMLFRYAWPHIRRIAVREVPNWYKDHLMRKQFEQELADAPTDS